MLSSFPFTSFLPSSLCSSYESRWRARSHSRKGRVMGAGRLRKAAGGGGNGADARGVGRGTGRTGSCGSEGATSAYREARREERRERREDRREERREETGEKREERREREGAGDEAARCTAGERHHAWRGTGAEEGFGGEGRKGAAERAERAERAQMVTTREQELNAEASAAGERCVLPALGRGDSGIGCPQATRQGPRSLPTPHSVTRDPFSTCSLASV